MSLSEEVSKRFPDVVSQTHQKAGDETIIVRGGDGILALTRALRDDPHFAFNYLIDLTAVDYLTMGVQPRFAVVYHLFSLEKNHRLRIKVPVEESNATLPSVTSIWPAANWFEREVWDMFGIHFSGHPNLKRILMYEEFKGHALRKDYPWNKRQPLIGPVN